jgi:dTDP-4-amino-4,6-dideoxygalactose transaminase
MIPYNKPYLARNAITYIRQAAENGKLSGNGYFTKRCAEYFLQHYGFGKILLTNSCTDALEMAAILCDIKPGDEVIMPSFTFPSCANAFLLRGAEVVFADCEAHVPNIDALQIEPLITKKTKAILVVHYAGIACNMSQISALAKKHNLFLIEDCAHSFDAYCSGKPLGSFGDFATFSFHETKNIHCGEGGMLVVNNNAYMSRAEIIWEKGTNRVAFSENKTANYHWIDIGSSFLMSELQAACLFAQLEEAIGIQKKRKQLWETYYQALLPLAEKKLCSLPVLPAYAIHNAHIFYLLCNSREQRNKLIQFLAEHSVMSVFHYLPLHSSPYYLKTHAEKKFPHAEHYSETLVRLPLFFDLTPEKALIISALITDFFSS